MTSPAAISFRDQRTASVAGVLALMLVLLVAFKFVIRYVFPYYLHYNAAGFGHNWPQRGWVLIHITSGMVALLCGPWQFLRWMRTRYLRLHRVMGRVYLIAIACGAIAAFYLASTTTNGRPWGLGLVGLTLAWITTAGMAYYAIRQRQIQVHQEWMVRSYIVTFAFVTFRFLSDTPPLSRLGPPSETDITYIWASWALPLLAGEVIMQARKMRKRATVLAPPR
jgi:uncharacterized membrane protein